MTGHDPYTLMLQRTVGGLRLAPPKTHKGLCVLPLVSTVECPAKYVLLESAISRGTLVVTETSEAGAVPSLIALNKGPWPVLIFDGEELVGAKQNRISNATILVNVGKSVLPVSCVEHGRWSHRSATFDSGDYAAHPSLRMQKERLVRRAAAAATARSGRQGEPRERARFDNQELRASRFGGAQAEVWAEVAQTGLCLGVSSDTEALSDSYAARGTDIDEYVEALDLEGDSSLQNLVGVMVFLSGRLVCVDLLRPSKRFRQLYHKLLRGYALEALVAATPGGRPIGYVVDDLFAAPGAGTPADFDPEALGLRLFAELNAARLQTQTSADLGQDLRLDGKTISGSGLAWNDDVIQVSVFPKVPA